MGRVIAVANQKGGVAKTTTAINLSSAIALEGRSILLMDMDPQGNATSGLGIDPQSVKNTMYSCLLKTSTIQESSLETSVPGLTLLPANADLAGAEVELVNVEGRENHLRSIIGEVREKYEFIFLDCPPALGILTINALTAADSVLIPVQCEYYAMEGLTRLIGTIDLVTQSFNPSLELEGIVLTMFDSRNTLSRQVAEQIRSHFIDKVYQTVIPRNVSLAEAPSYGRPGILYNVASAGSQAYVHLAKEFIAHGEKGPR
ncbi:ParA family protein [Nitrospira sp. BLG_2]|uniref:ParA family protein n=1 Tax=Nitrospira sp. BLG_2 TaxID=3397507 RepID=UPI003B9B6C37